MPCPNLSALAVFTRVRSSLPLAIRMVIVNVFLYTLFAYPNRHFFMPSSLLREVEAKTLSFMTPICWCKLGMFTAIGRLYGLRVCLSDLRISNVASLLSTHESWADIRAGNAEVISRWRRRMTCLANPAVSWKVAFDFYLHATGETYQLTLTNASRRRSPTRPFRVLRRQLSESEAPRWRDYFEQRVEAKGWVGSLLLRGLRRLPRSMPQAHRWFLLKVHLNAPMNSVRMAAAGRLFGDQRCAFCQSAPDSLSHVSQRPAVLAAYDGVASLAGLPPLLDARRALLLQDDWDGASVAGTVATFAAVWDIRAMCRRGVGYDGTDALVDLLWRGLQCPWLLRCVPSRDKRERRQARVREPDPVANAVIYRSDGACRGQGSSEESVAGWGAAVWAASADGRGSGPPTATARGFLGNNASNNVAEYAGLRACMERASRSPDPSVMFEVDSMLVAKQMCPIMPWACRSENLLGLHSDCLRLADVFEQNGTSWGIRHIYREFNQTADTLSNQAIDERDANGPSRYW